MEKTCIHSPGDLNSHLLANLLAMAPDTTGSWVAGDQDEPVLCDPKYKLRTRSCVVCGRVSSRSIESTGDDKKVISRVSVAAHRKTKHKVNLR
jgi:hypothetical protein